MSIFRSNFYFLLLITFFWNTVLDAQISSQEIDQLVEEAMEKFQVAGVAVGIVKDGKIIHNKGYGLKSITKDKKVNEHSQFAIASNSKAFTTAALALLIEDGKLDWRDKVKDHIPEFKMYDDYVTENFNIQDLLTHRSGLGLGAGDLMFFPPGANFTIDDLLSSFQHMEPVSAFRTKFDYDNLLYVVAGELIKRVSGMTWEKFVEERIFKPLKMDNTFASLSHIIDKSNLAMPHILESGKMEEVAFEEMIMNGAAGGIISNVDDLCNWMLLQLNQGKYGNEMEQQLFSERNHREMWRIHTVLEPRRSPRYDSHYAGYGLGWFLTDLQGKRSVSHTGGLLGMLSKTIMLPDLDLGVVVLTNTSNSGAGLFFSVSQTIIDSYLGIEKFDWVSEIVKEFKNNESGADSVSQKVWEIVNTNDDSEINEEDYVGVYKDNWFGKVEIFKNKDQLWFKSYRSPKLNGPMHFYKANTFAIKWDFKDLYTDAFAIFSLDEEGKAQSIKMKGISPNIDFSYDFHDLNLVRVEK